MTPEPSFDILVAGEINPDLILAGDVVPAFHQTEKLVDSAVLTIGSSSAIFACGARRLGLKVAFLGVCGDDLFGRFMLAEMQRRGVDVSHVIVRAGGQTGLSVILSRGADRAILTYPGLTAALRASDLSDTLLRSARHLHVASYFLQTKLQPDLPRLFQQARSFGLTTSLDTNYDPSEKWLGFDELLPIVDIFLPNKTEALSLTQSEEIGSAARQLADKCGVVAIKLGAEGAMLRAKEKTVFIPSIPVKIVDTVGAGDTFDAGFLYGYLNGWEMEKSLKLAVVCGALSLQAAGGTAAQPTLEEALAFLE